MEGFKKGGDGGGRIYRMGDRRIKERKMNQVN